MNHQKFCNWYYNETGMIINEYDISSHKFNNFEVISISDSEIFYIFDTSDQMYEEAYNILFKELANFNLTMLLEGYKVLSQELILSLINKCSNNNIDSYEVVEMSFHKLSKSFNIINLIHELINIIGFSVIITKSEHSQLYRTNDLKCIIKV